MKKRGIGIFLSVLCASVFLGGCGVLPFKEKAFYSKDGQKAADAKTAAVETPSESIPEPTEVPVEQKEDESAVNMQKVLDKAHLMSVQYDYDGANTVFEGTTGIMRRHRLIKRQLYSMKI